MAVVKHTSKGMDGYQPVEGVTFFSDVDGSHDSDKGWKKVIGVGVDESTRQVTHLVEWAKGMPEERKLAGQESIALIGGDALAAVKLKQPIDAEDFAKIADVSRDLQTTLGKFSKGLDTGAQTPEQRAASR